ncbi:YraN family protein [Candidatus Sumerlaeota bacterium]
MFSISRKRAPANHLALGRWGEEQAARFLHRRGWRIIERNFSCPAGEIDLIADDHGTLVFVEVRTRRDLSFGSPEETVDGKKAKRLERAAEWYLDTWRRAKLSWRFDIVAIEVNRDGRLDELTHFPAAF